MDDRDMKVENSAPIPQRTRQVYFQVGIIGLILAFTIWYAGNTGTRIATQYSPLVHASMKIKLESTIAHLWFEEIIVGDTDVDIAEMWNHIDQSEWYAQAMLDGGENDEGVYVPLADPKLRQEIQEVLEKIRELRAIAEERLADIESSTVGSNIDQRFDNIFKSFLKQTADVKIVLQQIMARDIGRFKSVRTGLLVSCFLLTGLIAVILHRFQRRQSINVAKLAAGNQQLQASEQQLKATNLQLRAGEQQLKATNQQLRAGEQQLRASNQQLRQSQQKLALHIENTPLGVIQWGADWCVTEWNKAAERIFGFTREEALGRHAVGLIIKDTESIREIVDGVWEDLLKQKGDTRSVNENIRKDQKSIMCDWYNTPLIDEDGTTLGVASLVLDISETHRLQELESRAERLETAGTIAGQVAHDFNNLLAPMMAYPEFIHEILPHDSKAHTYLEAIENAARKIANINQDLLTMGRRGHFNFEVMDLNRIVLQVAQEMESRTKTVAVEVDLCEDLMRIRGGGAQIHRMLTNLVVNALDAMDDIGAIRIISENYYADDTSIAFGRVPKGEYVKLTVSDTGCGIPKDILQKILDPFFSTKATDRKRGSGLGLSVVDSVVKDHDGYLDMTSEVGHGTSFFVYFPVTREEFGSDEAKRLVGGSEKLLVVDDDSVQRDVSTQLLKKLGYQISTVDSGEKAIEFLRENPQDLVILDMVMPGGIDGAETYRQIVEINPAQKAIILSGFSESDRVLEAQKLGAGAFVKKPITRMTIATSVRTELDRPVKILDS